MQVYAGTAVQTTVTFTNPTGVATTPSTVTLEFRYQGGTKTTYTYGSTGNITKVSTGVYKATLTTDTSKAPMWTVKWTGTGACAAVEVATFTVQSPPF